MDLRKYFHIVTNCVKNNGLVIDPPDKPIILQSFKGEVVKIDTPKTYIKFKNGQS